MFLAVPVDLDPADPRHNLPYIQDDAATVAKVIDGQGGPIYDDIKYYKINFNGPNNIPSITAEVRIKPSTRSQVRSVESVELEVGGQVVGQGEVEV